MAFVSNAASDKSVRLFFCRVPHLFIFSLFFICLLIYSFIYLFIYLLKLFTRNFSKVVFFRQAVSYQ